MIPLIFFVVIISLFGSKADSVVESFDGKPYFSFIWELEEFLVGLNPFVLEATPRPPPPSVADYCKNVPANEIYDLPDYFDCHAFWRCETSSPVWHQCQLMDQENRMVFNPPQQRCDPPWQYPCQGGGDSTATTTLPTSTTELKTTTSPSTSTPISAPPTDNPTTDLTSSFPITTVDPEMCTSVDDIPVPPTIDSICSQVSTGNLNLPYYGNCHKYWQCRGQEICLMSCGYNDGNQLVFNPVLGRCDDEWHYPCDIFEPVLPPTP